jgi:hypothetical protein
MSALTDCGDVDFSMPNIEEVFTHYDIWEGLQNFRDKTGPLYPKHMIKREDKYCANCIKFEEENPYFISTYSEPDEIACKKVIKSANKYPYILIELPELLYVKTAMQNNNLVEINKPYLVECEQHSGIVIVKNFMKGYYVFEQNNGSHILILDAHIQLLNDKEKRYLGI